MPSLRGHFLFCAMAMICFNGDFLSDTVPIVGASNRSFRYGDAVFETGRVEEGRWQLQQYHMQRLFAGLEALEMNANNLDADKLSALLLEVCRLNNCLDSARVRLQAFRTESGAGYIIEAASLPKMPLSLPQVGYKVDIYPKARKAMDAFANLKSSNYLPYVMAERFAQQRGLDEAIVLNAEGNICDGSKTNLFMVRENKILTPALHQGCVNGVMRRHVMEQLRLHKYEMEETVLTQDDLLTADSIFLTNAVRGICWVEWFREQRFLREGVQPVLDSVQPTK
jgi:branched-chain amino acid aminotransferase